MLVGHLRGVGSRMSDDFYPFVDSGDPAPGNEHLHQTARDGSAALSTQAESNVQNLDGGSRALYATRIAVYDDMLSTPRVLVVDSKDVRTYLEEVTNTTYRCMKEQGGRLSLMVIREIVENFIHAHFAEPVISILDNGDTIRFADQGPGIDNKEQAFEFGVTSADREKKRYIRGTGAGFPMVQQYLENAGGAISIEDNLGQGTVVTVTVDPGRTREVEASSARGAAVRGAAGAGGDMARQQPASPSATSAGYPVSAGMEFNGAGCAPAPGWPAGTQAPAYAGYQPYQAAYPMHGAQPWPQQPVYQGYPAFQQPVYQQPAGMWPAMAAMPAAPQAPVPMNPGAPHVSERGRAALAYLMANGIAGPTDLAHALGASNATWSRELDALGALGLVVKQGQKRVLTEMGRVWLEQEGGGAQPPVSVS